MAPVLTQTLLKNSICWAEKSNIWRETQHFFGKTYFGEENQPFVVILVNKCPLFLLKMWVVVLFFENVGVYRGHRPVSPLLTM
jgi:hypothetical protein